MSELAVEVPAEAIEAFRTYQSNLRWAKENGRKLERYAGKSVAVASGKILESSSSGEELERKYHDVPGVYIARVAHRGLRWVL